MEMVSWRAASTLPAAAGLRLRVSRARFGCARVGASTFPVLSAVDPEFSRLPPDAAALPLRRQINGARKFPHKIAAIPPPPPPPPPPPAQSRRHRR
ncbi:hypothetical protein RB195_011418 [Necator americanus]|uniref:Uncharacterized protein n=1 Tax=Necator americanus TaxID=51031 RepID=A0ABR1D2B1_NECAM